MGVEPQTIIAYCDQYKTIRGIRTDCKNVGFGFQEDLEEKGWEFVYDYSYEEDRVTCPNCALSRSWRE